MGSPRGVEGPLVGFQGLKHDRLKINVSGYILREPWDLGLGGGCEAGDGEGIVTSNVSGYK